MADINLISALSRDVLLCRHYCMQVEFFSLQYLPSIGKYIFYNSYKGWYLWRIYAIS